MSLQDTIVCDGCEERIDLEHNYCPTCGLQIEHDWPYEFSCYASADLKTSEVLKMNSMPHSDDIMDALYYYPGEIEVVGELSEELEANVKYFRYNGKKYTSE